MMNTGLLKRFVQKIATEGMKFVFGHVFALKFNDWMRIPCYGVYARFSKQNQHIYEWKFVNLSFG